MASKEDSSNDPNAQTVPGVPNAKDDLYEDRPMAKKIVRIITVVAYLVSVSFVAIVLSGYYIFLWQPPPGGSLSLRDPQAEFLMESPPERTHDNKSIHEILEKINLFRKNGVKPRRFNRTRSSKDGNLTKLMGLMGRNRSWGNSDTSTGVYESFSRDKLKISVNTSEIDVSTTLGDFNNVSEASSTVQGEEFSDDERNFTDFKGIFQEKSVDDHHEMFTDITSDDFNVTTEFTTSEGIKEKTTQTKPNATKSIYPQIYIDEDQPIERPTDLEASLDPLPTINPTSSEYQEDISEENIEEPLDIEFDGDNLPRR